MKEVSPASETKERLADRPMSIIVVGDACSGKTTLLKHLETNGYSVRPEPENPMFPMFLKNPGRYAYHNQLYKTAQLMEQEIQAAESDSSTSPRFNESGVLATDIYNRYLRDQKLMTEDQFRHINGIYTNYLDTMPNPDMVVYLHANDDTIRERAMKRDGLVAHDPHMLEKYWARLLEDLEKRGIPVYRVNTGDRGVEKTADMVLSEADRLKREGPPKRPDIGRAFGPHHVTLSWMEFRSK